jgi:ADP-ribose pyrophosphatase YjhB (NUDIX family)
MKSFHSIQIKILQDLLYNKYLRYSDLKPKEMEGSQFTFHLESLGKQGLIKKNSKGYCLTPKGKEIANRMDYGDANIKVQAKISAIMCCIREENDVTEYLLYTRKKNPFWGYQGFPTGKVIKGEDISNTAKRELYEETGLNGIPELFAIRHYRIYSNEELLLEDKIFFVFRFMNPKGDLASGREGDFKWVNRENVNDYLERPVKELPEIIDALEKFSGEITFLEGSYTTEGF